MLLSNTLSQPRALYMQLPQDKTPPSSVLLYPVLKAEDLLLYDPMRRNFVNKIAQYTGLEASLYQTLYETSIIRFAELVQALPHQGGGAAGSLLDTSLERAVVVIRHYHQSVTGTDFSALYAYALFTAALFQDSGKLLSQQAVMICDGDGKFISEWSPVEGSLLAVKAAHYKFHLLDDRWIQLGQSATPLLARQCMPAPGFEWIASNHEIFDPWMRALTGNTDHSSSFLNFLQLSTKLMSLLAKKDRLNALKIDATRPIQTAVGEDFLAWLNAGLNDGTIVLNTADANVHVLANGELLLEPGIFQQFCKVYGRSTGWMVVSKQFDTLGLTEAASEEMTFQKFILNTSETVSNENLARNPKIGGFFNVGTVAMASMIREGLVVFRPDLMQLHKVTPGPANLTPVSVSEKRASDLSSLQKKVDNWAQESPLQKPFLER